MSCKISRLKKNVLDWYQEKKLGDYNLNENFSDSRQMQQFRFRGDFYLTLGFLTGWPGIMTNYGHVVREKQCDTCN